MYGCVSFFLGDLCSVGRVVSLDGFGVFVLFLGVPLGADWRAYVRGFLIFFEEVVAEAVEVVVVVVEEGVATCLAGLASGTVKGYLVAYVLHVLLKSLSVRIRWRALVPESIEGYCPPFHSERHLKIRYKVFDQFELVFVCYYSHVV